MCVFFFCADVDRSMFAGNAVSPKPWEDWIAFNHNFTLPLDQTPLGRLKASINLFLEVILQTFASVCLKSNILDLILKILVLLVLLVLLAKQMRERFPNSVSIDILGIQYAASMLP